MTSLITCNFCHASIKSGYGTPTLTVLTFDIEDDETQQLRIFQVDFKLTANFNSTNVHWCRRCILKALYKRIGELI